jgi:N-sulfoglucosamine sulfohydrolase
MNLVRNRRLAVVRSISRQTSSCRSCFTSRSRLVSTLALLVGALSVWIGGWCRSDEPGNGLPNVLWLIAENIGPDLACYRTRQVRTPHLDQLAAEGMRYTHAFATGPVCSSSRSAFMTGMYQTTIGAHNHVTREQDRKSLPPGVRPVTHWLRDAGYFTANVRHLTDDPRLRPYHRGTGKAHLNFRLDSNTFRAATWVKGDLFDTDRWQDLKGHQPFFAQVNFPNVERSVRDYGGDWLYVDKNPRFADPAKVDLPPYYPDTPVVRKDWAGYLDSVSGLDVQVGWVLDRLVEDGLADNTVVIFFADNGRLEARGLDWCYDSGLHVPLVVRWPKNYPPPSHYRAGASSDQLISLIDVTATTLAIASVKKPDKMQGRVFLGSSSEARRRYVFGARDRTDEAVNRIRTVRTARYRYIRNFMPDKAFLAPHVYKEAHYPVYRILRQYQAEGKLTPAQATLTAPRLPDEELYDTENDPYEVKNLTGSSGPDHRRVLEQLRSVLDRWIEESNDQGRIPEPPEAVEYWKQEAYARHGQYLK